MPLSSSLLVVVVDRCWLLLLMFHFHSQSAGACRAKFAPNDSGVPGADFEPNAPERDKRLY